MYGNMHCIMRDINSEEEGEEEAEEEEEEENLSWNVSFIHRRPVSKQPENMTLPTRRSEDWGQMETHRSDESVSAPSCLTDNDEGEKTGRGMRGYITNEAKV